jgi:hypothetical protein
MLSLHLPFKFLDSIAVLLGLLTFGVRGQTSSGPESLLSAMPVLA